MEHGVDDFLADLAGFQGDFGALPPFIELDEAAADLLWESNELLAETEALLMTRSAADSLRAPTRRATTVKDTSTLKTVQAPNRRLKYREKVKNERQLLQEEETKLSEELSYLRHARKRSKALGKKHSSTSVWKAIATRQKEGRLVAQEQQRGLKIAVENRAKVIQEIGEIVHERLHGADSTGNAEVSIRRSSLELNADDMDLFEEFLHEMDVLHARTDEVFRSSGVGETPLTFYKMEPEVKRDGDMVYVDNLDVLPIPFSYEDTCAVMWQSMLRVYRQRDRHHYGGAVNPENTIAVKFRLQPLGNSGKPVDMMVLFVMRRYVEANRMILVWRALSEGEGECAGMHSDESGWCIVRPIDHEVDYNSIMQTVMETFVRFIPSNLATKCIDEVDAYQFAKLVVTSAEEDAGEIARMMDSLLLD